MAVNKKSPQQAGIEDIGKNYIPPGSIPVYVGGGKDSWGSIAARLNITPKQLVEYNFKTNIPEVVNFYLERNVGCTTVALDGRNYSFAGAIPGVIYAPPAIAPPKAPTKIDPVLLLMQWTILPMEMRQHPKLPDHYSMRSVFHVHVALNPKLSDPTLYEYRQLVRGSGFIQEGEWVGGVWQPKKIPSTWVGGVMVDSPERHFPPSSFPVPGIPFGLQKFWKEDGERDASGTNHFYGHRENPPVPAHAGKNDYSDRGYRFFCEDQPGIKRSPYVLGLLVSLTMEFKGTVVEFDKPPGTPGRKILRTVAEKDWSYTCKRKVKSISPLVVVP